VGSARAGSGYSALVGNTTTVNASELDDVIVARVGADLSSPSSLLINIEDSRRGRCMRALPRRTTPSPVDPPPPPPPEEVFIDGKSYFSVTSRNSWDCESMLSTYSEFGQQSGDHRQGGGGGGRRERKKKEKGGNGGM
jgi:hypothetical protein